MDYREVSVEERRARWWERERQKFDLPAALYRPRPFAVILIAVLGAGSAFVGLFPGLDMHNLAVSGVGASWIGLLTLLIVAGLWYWRDLQHGYPPRWMAGIVAAAALVAVIVTTLFLSMLSGADVGTLDTLVGGLGAGPLMAGLGLFMGLLLGDGVLLGVLLGLIIGVVAGVMLGLPKDLPGILLMAAIFGSVIPLVAGTAALAHRRVKALLKR